ncbi:MAG TPA: YXWGXW repeat-containing protein [Gemmatales bacterium]|nr:YXWGXW repeat-containing protein [Gemmatales bacterium]
MKRNDGLTGFWCMVSTTLLVVLASLHPVSQAQDTSRNGQPADNGQEILTRGPIHEAFGQPTVFNPKPGLLIPKKPPQPVEELPPDEKPEGDNVAWLGGYWSWDEDKNDFLWVSGFWRVLPPGRQWIPGYWNENAGQYQWVSGYWANAELEEEQVIQQPPPESLEQGAPPTAPSQEHIWAPGTWVYRERRYMWRPGYWIVAQPGWSWIPASYVWTPGGYIFVDGYWDWSIRRRGILFAPCYFDYNVIYRPGFVYRPAVCLDIDIITPHFFCRPAYSHYYFGDYYATSYLSVGITPWFNFTYARGPRFYSSDFVYYENHFRRTNPNWARDVRLGYERHRDNVHLRPARTFVSQQTVINNITINNINNNNTRIVNNNTNVNNLALAKPIKTYTAKLKENPDAPIKVERINENRVREFGRNAAEVRKIAGERVTMERQLATPGKTGSTAGTETAIRRVTLPKSPIVSKMPINNGETDDKNPNVGSIGKTVSRTPPPVPGQNRDLKQITRGSSPVTARPGSGKNADPGNSGNGTTAAGNTAGNKTGGTAGNPGANPPMIRQNAAPTKLTLPKQTLQRQAPSSEVLGAEVETRANWTQARRQERVTKQGR